MRRGRVGEGGIWFSMGWRVFGGARGAGALLESLGQDVPATDWDCKSQPRSALVWWEILNKESRNVETGMMKQSGLGFCDEEEGTANLANLANFEEGGCEGWGFVGYAGTGCPCDGLGLQVPATLLFSCIPAFLILNLDFHGLVSCADMAVGWNLNGMLGFGLGGCKPPPRSPFEEAGDGGSEGGFEDGGFAVGDGDGDFAEGFIGWVLSGDAEEPGGAVGIAAGAEVEGAAGFFGLVEEFCLRNATLEGGEDVAEICEAPFHGDFVVPVELALAGLGCGIKEDGGFGAIEAEADDAASAAGVGLVDGVIGGTGSGGGGFRGGFVHEWMGLVVVTGKLFG